MPNGSSIVCKVFCSRSITNSNGSGESDGVVEMAAIGCAEAVDAVIAAATGTPLTLIRNARRY